MRLFLLLKKEKEKRIMAEKKRKDRTEEMKALTAQLEAGIQEVFDSENYKKYLKFMGKFRKYSVNNSILIQKQCPEATQVAGFNTWKSLKRFVKANEKGIKIMSGIPMKKQKDKKDAAGNQVLDKNGKPVKEEVQFMHFRPAYVFDVSQTGGEPLPEAANIEELSGTVQCYDEIFRILSNGEFPVELRKLDGSTKGYFSEAEGKIVLNIGMSEAQTIKTLIHETAHSMLHTDSGKKLLEKRGIPYSRKDAEVAAESIAYVVCQHFGIDTSDYSFGYIANWAEGKSLRELKGSLEIIRETAGEIIDEIVAGFAA